MRRLYSIDGDSVMSTRFGLLSCSSLFLVSVALFGTPSYAATSDADVQKMLSSLAKQEQLVKSQQKVLNEQSKKLAAQEKQLADNRAMLEALAKKVDAKATMDAVSQDQVAALAAQPKVSENDLRHLSGAGVPSEKDAKDKPADKKPAPSTATSITAPPKEEKRPEIAALPDSGGVLTPKGVLMYENSLDYVNTTSNVFTFNGVQLADVVFIGYTNATTAKRQVIQDSNRFRIGLTNYLEADVRVPYVYRNETSSVTNTSTSTTVRKSIEGNGLGDIDGGVSYQLNRGKDGAPFFVANARYKANNANGPFDVDYDADSVAKELPTGTGYHSAEASLTAIKVSDPAVLFGNIGYVYNFEDTVDKEFGNTRVLKLDPGNAVNASAGMGFSINPETSFTLGYKHSYVFKTTQYNQAVDTGIYSKTESDTASAGALLVGGSYRINPITSLNMNVEVGATREAPDVRVGFRVPVRLGTWF